MKKRLIPCGGCGRHVRSGDASCPFCGAPAKSDALGAVAGVLAASAMLIATGCGDSTQPAASPDTPSGSAPTATATATAEPTAAPTATATASAPATATPSPTTAPTEDPRPAAEYGMPRPMPKYGMPSPRR